MEEFKPRIPNEIAVLMLATAIFYSVLKWLLAIILMGWLITILSYMTFLLWYQLRDVGFLERFGAKKVIAWIVVPFIDLLTLGIVPGIVCTVILVISIVKFEDKLIEKGVVSRDDLRKLESFVLKTGKTHGFDSPQFNHALASNLGRNIEDRYNQKTESIRNRYVQGEKAKKAA